MNTPKIQKPLLFSCSGCSSAAQMANAIALSIDRQGVAEMSCLAGIGAGIEPFLSQARQAEAIVAIDGCSQRCAGKCLEKEGLAPFLHYDLSRYGVNQELHKDFSAGEASAIQADIVHDILLQGAQEDAFLRRAVTYAI